MRAHRPNDWITGEVPREKFLKRDSLGAQHGKESACNAGDSGSIPGSERFPWTRAWQPTTVLLPGVSHGQRSLEGYSPRGFRVRDHLATNSTNIYIDKVSHDYFVQGFMWILSQFRNVDPVPFAFLAQLAPKFTLQHQRPSGDF